MSLLGLYLTFLRFGLLCFGGGYMLVPLLNDELVGSAITHEEFVRLISIAQATPGPIGINTATYVGYIQHGIIGGAVATMGIATPSLLLMVGAIVLFKRYASNPLVRGFLAGMRPAALGLVLAGAMIFAELSLFTVALPWKEWFTGLFGGAPAEWPQVGIRPVAVAIAAAAMIVQMKWRLNFFWLLFLGAAAGAFFCR